MKKYTITLTLFKLAVSFTLFLGINILLNKFIFKSNMQIASIVQLSLYIAFGVVTMNIGSKAHRCSRRNDLNIITFMSIFVALCFIVSWLLLNEYMELSKLFILCISLPILGFIIYFFGRRFLRKN